MQREPDQTVVAWLDEQPRNVRHFEDLGIRLVDSWKK
jgi:hypothetical protein